MTDNKQLLVWETLISQKDDYIGGRIIEKDKFAGDADTIIVDILLRSNGDINVMIVVVGAEWEACSDVRYATLIDKGSYCIIHTQFGHDWYLYKKGK